MEAVFFYDLALPVWLVRDCRVFNAWCSLKASLAQVLMATSTKRNLLELPAIFRFFETLV